MPLGLVASLLVGGTVFAQPPGEASGDEPAARVNETVITTRELNHLFLARTQVPYLVVQGDQRAQEIRRQLLDTLVDRELLLQESKIMQITVSPQKLDAEL